MTNPNDNSSAGEDSPASNRHLFHEKFKALGWNDDAQSTSIFNFLMQAAENVEPGAVLLDLGAGQCRYEFFFEHCNYLAVDFAKGDERWDFSKLDLLADISETEYIRDESVDYCLNTTTLEHISEPARFFGGVGRILKPGGRLYLYVPFVIAEHQVPYDFYRYTSYGLRHLCEKSGLRVVSVEPSNGPLYTGIRWAERPLSDVRCKKFFVKATLKIIRFVFGRLLVPLFDRLDKYSTMEGFPQCWLLVAEKEGRRNIAATKKGERRRALESIIRCPSCRADLERRPESYRCVACGAEYPIKNDQVVFLD